MPTISRGFALFAALGFVVTGCGKSDAPDGQTTFNTPDEALTAFVAAARAGNTAALDSMLGPGGQGIVTSSDTIADQAERSRFLERYDEHHALVDNGKDTLTLNVGATDWPVPVPLVKVAGKWRWDGEAGRDEVFYRRIGHNELKAIAVCNGVVEAQMDYAETPHDGHPAGAFATRIFSTAGTQDGLYWPVKQGDPPSPLGPGVAAAGGQGYDTSGVATPYHGYYYRMLPNPAGFGLVAFPADYRQSGVMTFQVDQTGLVYQKDLGEATDSLARQMTDYHIDDSWKPAE